MIKEKRRTDVFVQHEDLRKYTFQASSLRTCRRCLVMKIISIQYRRRVVRSHFVALGLGARMQQVEPSKEYIQDPAAKFALRAPGTITPIDQSRASEY